MATKTQDATLSAAAPSLASGARHNGAKTVDAKGATVKKSKKDWWRCFLRCLCCFGGRRRRRAGMTPPSHLPSAPTPACQAVHESSPFPGLTCPKSPAVEEDFPLLSAPLPPSPEPEEPSPLPPAPAPVPLPDISETVITPAKNKKNKRKRKRRKPKATTDNTVTPPPNPPPAPAPAPTNTLTPTAAPAVTSSPTPAPTPACAEEHEATEDVLGLVLLRRGQELPYNRVVYVEGEDATDGDRWTESRCRRDRERRPLPQEPVQPAPTPATTTEAAAASRGRRPRRRRRPLQQEPRAAAPTTTNTPKAAAAAVAARQPRGRQRTAPGPVWASWQEPEVECLLPVPPHLRRCIVGRGGANLRDLRRQFPAVRVRVPPPLDTTSRSVAIEGPRAQAHAALAHLRARLQGAAAPTPCT